LIYFVILPFVNLPEFNMPSRIEQLTAYLAASPNDPFLRYALGLEFWKLGDTQTAYQYLSGLTQQYPDYLGTYYQLGKLCEVLQLFDQALTTYQAGMALARTQNDHHTLSELRTAFNALNDELFL
jgi:tetratricopeptide (TPR) repeat protein